MKFFLMVALSCTACAPSPPHPHVVNIAYPFQKCFVDFENDSAMAGHFQDIDDLIIQFSTDAYTLEYAGDCANQPLLDVNATPTININPNYWPQMTDDQQCELVYHEMGHCILDRGHKNTLWNGVPNSIMYYQVFPAGLFTQYHFHYVTELFTGAP